jgi:hypothetical protein
MVDYSTTYYGLAVMITILAGGNDMPSKKSNGQSSTEKHVMQVEITIKTYEKPNSATRPSRVRRNPGLESLLRCIKNLSGCVGHDHFAFRIIRE